MLCSAGHWSSLPGALWKGSRLSNTLHAWSQDWPAEQEKLTGPHKRSQRYGQTHYIISHQGQSMMKMLKWDANHVPVTVLFTDTDNQMLRRGKGCGCKDARTRANALKLARTAGVAAVAEFSHSSFHCDSVVRGKRPRTWSCTAHTGTLCLYCANVKFRNTAQLRSSGGRSFSIVSGCGFEDRHPKKLRAKTKAHKKTRGNERVLQPSVERERSAWLTASLILF